MAQKGKPGLSAKQKKDLWLRWKDGQSLTEIGRAIGKHPGLVHGVVVIKRWNRAAYQDQMCA